MKINIEITKGELDALEGLATVWILCKKHTAQTLGKSAFEIAKMKYSCKECMKEAKLVSNKTRHLWSKLTHAYNIARYGKCDCDVKPKKKDFSLFGVAKGFTPFVRDKKRGRSIDPCGLLTEDGDFSGRSCVRMVPE